MPLLRQAGIKRPLRCADVQDMWKHLLIGLVMGCVVGCGGSDAGADADGEESPQQLARENAKLSEEAMRESDKGVDDSGDRVWKHDARAFFDFGRNPDNRTFELDPDWARQFVETAYAAGAPKVWVTTISEFEMGGDRVNISDNMVVVLPSSAAKRQAILGAYNAELEQARLTPLADVGQDYLLVAGD